MNAFDLAYAVGGVLLAPVWARKARGGWGERFGHTPALPEPAAGRKRLLLHAVSVGEVSAIRGLVAELTPHVEVVVATTTDTGLARARELFKPPVHVVRYPLDFTRSVERFLDAVRPDGVGLVELELWPNFIASARRRGIPVAVVNGRLSARSFRGYRRIRPVMQASFGGLHLAAVQDRHYAERFIAMGARPERVVISDTMKWDAAPAVPPGGAASLSGVAAMAADFGIDPSRPLIVAGSTAEGEEAMLHEACPPGVQLLCAPRKPERFDAAAAALPGCVRRSRTAGRAGTVVGRITPVPAAPPINSPTRFLLDTIGELRTAYALADVVVVGRSLVDQGGSDPIEPAALGKAVLIGPFTRNFTTVVETLSAAGGLQVVAPGELRAVLERLLADAPRRAAMGQAAVQCVSAHKGATRRHAELLLRMLAEAARPDGEGKSTAEPPASGGASVSSAV